MTFFTDECFMYKANALIEAFDRDNEIRPLLDCFDRGTPDTVWIPAIAKWQPKPVVVCGDGRILRNKVERAVLKEAELTFVCLAAGWTNLAWDVFAWKIIKAWPGIRQNCSQALRPTVFEVSPSSLKIEKAFHL